MSGLELSIIIPTLNEAGRIDKLIAGLSAQQSAPAFEVIIADGGSQDDTLHRVQALGQASELSISVVSSQSGRARQMNEAVFNSSSEALLFLHADTVITDPSLLYHAHQDMKQAYESCGHERVAGHFGLHFIREATGYEAAYYFYECKTRLNRPGCINGDQGIWIGRDFFNDLQGFDESLGYMEDARLAKKVFEQGEWLTLSSAVFTSARRFETEGLRARQTLNALLCNFDEIGMHAFFEQADQAYRDQGKIDYLELKPFLKIVHKVSWHKGISQGFRWWWLTGKYVASNAWQLAFAMDCKESFQKELPVSDVEVRHLESYDRFFKPIVESVFGQALAAFATFCWFYWSLLFSKS